MKVRLVVSNSITGQIFTANPYPTSHHSLVGIPPSGGNETLEDDDRAGCFWRVGTAMGSPFRPFFIPVLALPLNISNVSATFYLMPTAAMVMVVKRKSIHFTPNRFQYRFSVSPTGIHVIFVKIGERRLDGSDVGNRRVLAPQLEYRKSDTVANIPKNSTNPKTAINLRQKLLATI